MKKLLAMLAAMGITASLLAGCGNGGAAESAAPDTIAQTDDETSATTDTGAAGAQESYRIGICQLVQHDALDSATKGFKDAMIDTLGEDRVSFDEQNASGDSATCATITNQFVSADVDLILANATASLQAAAAATDTIPILGTSITDYATALELDDWNGVTGRNISGTSDLAPLSDQAEMFKELFPEAKTVGILFCSAEANSVYQADVIEECLTTEGFTCNRYTFSDSNDIASVTTTAAGECDAIYVPTDNTAASNTEIINNICEPAGVPIITGEGEACRGCGVATLSISYYDIGYKAGEMACEILENGADITTMEVVSASDLTKQYIPDRCERLGVAIPDTYEALEAGE